VKLELEARDETAGIGEEVGFLARCVEASEDNFFGQSILSNFGVLAAA
jgi:hypothetical protein